MTKRHAAIRALRQADADLDAYFATEGASEESPECQRLYAVFTAAYDNPHLPDSERAPLLPRTR